MPTLGKAIVCCGKEEGLTGNGGVNVNLIFYFEVKSSESNDRLWRRQHSVDVRSYAGYMISFDRLSASARQINFATF